MQNSCGNVCTQECDWKSEFKISFWKNTAAIREDGWYLRVSAFRWYCWYLYVFVSTQRVLVMFLYVCQHSDYMVMTVCLSAHIGYWWCFCMSVSMHMMLVMPVSISRWRIFIMFVYLRAYRWSWCCPASFYGQSTAGSFGRYTAHLIFGNSDRGRLLNPMFCTKKLGTIGYQLLISSTKNWTFIPQWNRGTNPTCFLLRHFEVCLNATSVLFQTWIKY
jgi:hypothetical protein